MAGKKGPNENSCTTCERFITCKHFFVSSPHILQKSNKTQTHDDDRYAESSYTHDRAL